MEKVDNFQPVESFILDSLWLIEIFLGLFVIFFLGWGAHKLIKRLSSKAQSSSSSFIKKIDYILLQPSQVFFTALAIYYCVSIAGPHFGLAYIVTASKPFISAIVVICCAWVAMRWKKQVIHTLKHHPKMVSSGLGHTLGKLLSIVIFVLAALIVLQIFSIDIWPLLAFGGIGAAAVGFAAKDVISNFCGGLMLSITRPFLVGDQILLPSSSLEGPVEEIGWYLTVIRDKDKRPVYLPNAIFSSALVINTSRMSHRRIKETIGIRFQDFDKLELLLEKIRVFLAKHPSADPSLPAHVYLNAFGEHALNIYLDAYVKALETSHYLAVREEIFMGMYKILKESGAELSSPTLGVEILKTS